jgi:hypothetical protein
MLNPTELIEIIDAVQLYEATNRIPEDLKATHPYSATALWTFYLDTEHQPEGPSCIYCKMFDGQTFIGADLRRIFPDHKWKGTDIYANVHKTLWNRDDTCGCLLIREPDTEHLGTLSFWDGSISTDWTQTPQKGETDT